MTEPEWATSIRERTEQLIQALQQSLPEDAGPVAIERALMVQESPYFGDLAQLLIDAQPHEKKVTTPGD